MSKSEAESITVSLDWAKKLKEAGWPQEASSCVCEWALKGRPAGLTNYEELPEWKVVANRFSLHCHTFAAPTAEEILRRFREMPMAELNIRPWPTYGWRIEHDVPNGRAISNPSLANAAAAMYCYLSNNKLLPYPSSK